MTYKETIAVLLAYKTYEHTVYREH